jgi:hypothetical protein
MRATLKLLLGLWIVPALAFGQDAYATPSDTLFYMLVNPYRMYWIRNGDTLSQPVHAVSVEAQQWARTRQELRVVVRQLQLDVHRAVRTDTFSVTPLGAVRAINGHAPGMNERVDLVPRLPRGKLAAGVTWVDTLSATQPGGPVVKAYGVTRTWRVERLFDSAGTRWATISASGVIHYRDAWWADSTAGSFASLDVTGPLTERVLFSVTQRQLLERSWSTNLTGRGILPNEHGADTTAAGLISSETQRLISPDRAHLLARPFAGVDTTYSYNQGTIFLHVVDREHTTIGTAMARNDGLVGTAHASFTSGRVSSYDAVWTDTAVTPRRIAISVVGDSLKIHQTGSADTTVVIPEQWWGIADYAMNELLIPVFLAHAVDTTAGFAIYRPYAGHWDTGRANIRRYGDNFVVSYRLGGDTLQTVLLITPDGELLMAENSGPRGARRLPPPGSAQSARLEAILEQTRKGP